MELVYLWVENYKNIKKQGFNFSSQIKCEYDMMDKILTINNSASINLFEKSKVKFSLIVGENGVGKSNLTQIFSQIQNSTIHGNYNEEEKYIGLFPDLNYLIVFFDEGHIWIFHPYLNKILNNTSYTIIYDKSIIFHTEFNFAFYNTSIFEEYVHKDNLNYLYETIVLNNEYLIETIMLSSRNNILKNIFDQEKTTLNNLILYNEFEVDYLNRFFSWIDKFLIKNLEEGIDIIEGENEQYKLETSECKKELDNVYPFLIDTNKLSNNQKRILVNLSVLGGLDGFDFSSQEGYYQVLLIVIGKRNFSIIEEDFILFFEKNYILKNSDDNKYIISLEIDMFNTWDKYKDDIKKLLRNNFLKYKLAINYKNKKIDIDKLSSGEKSILLVKLIINKLLEEYHNKKPNQDLIIFLDEPETYLHPMLQKKLINDLHQVFKDFKYNIHIIITSHSPFLLSDVSKDSVVFLDKFGYKTKKKYPKLNIDALEHGDCINVSEYIDIDPFGANIHTLLSNGFFMKDGLMGEFAKSKINDVINYLKPDKQSTIQDDKEAKSIIDIIGEPILKKTLQTMYDAKVYKDESKLDILKRKQKEIEEAIEEELKNERNKSDEKS